MIPLFIMETIKEAKKFIEENITEGVKCPCCLRLIKLETVRFSEDMALFLIMFYKWHVRNGFDHYVNFYELIETFNDDKVKFDFSFVDLKHWGLIEQGEGKYVQYWKLTDLGFKFVIAEAVVQEFAHLVSGEFKSFSGSLLGIVGMLEGKYSYKELMDDN